MGIIGASAGGEGRITNEAKHAKLLEVLSELLVGVILLDGGHFEDFNI